MQTYWQGTSGRTNPNQYLASKGVAYETCNNPLSVLSNDPRRSRYNHISHWMGKLTVATVPTYSHPGTEVH